MKQIFENVFKKGKKILTKNIVPGKSIYNEQRISENGIEYREWDPYKSKPAAAILRGLKNFPIKKGTTILYLGIASGTTASHFCDIIGDEGIIIGVDLASKTFEKLLEVAQERESIVPVFADAGKPEKYEEYLEEKVDVLYQDVSQRNQADIFLRNLKFLKKDGWAIIAVKSRCIDVSKDPKEVFEMVLKILKTELKIIETVDLGNFEKDHLFIVCKKK